MRRYEFTKYRAFGPLYRITHWIFAGSCLVLIFTGYYIYNPWFTTMLETGTDDFTVANIRFLHFAAGYIFLGAVTVRVYLWFFGNKQERITDALPINKRNLKNFWGAILNYLYIKFHVPRLGHNALAGTTYLVTFLLSMVMIVSGFYLMFPESASWQHWGLAFFGGQQNARMVHFIIMFYFIFFAMVHIYIAIWNDVMFGEGLVSAIISGSKFLHIKRPEVD
ncbi:MAG: Ni/Fe-hydrogenase, b-type cytochrome subunit [Deltaproteobacteria bacterium]|nr:Ni/Fe-hydrogenase, b-type cytochrome subunit [Deltaproteobacteria bacterium]